MMQNSRIYFRVAVPLQSVPAASAWKILTLFLKDQSALSAEFFLSQIAGHPQDLRSDTDLRLSPKAIERVIEKRNLSGFRVHTGHCNAGRHLAFTFSGATLSCAIENEASSPNDWTGLIESCLNKFPGIGGWQMWWPYCVWQYLDSPDDFAGDSKWGPLPPGYRSWHERDKYGIGPGQNRMDISLNPGRYRSIAPNVRFFPTAEMWLGPHFWQYAKCSKEEALAADFFLEKRDTPNFLYLKCWSEPFTRPDGEQGRMQQRLWKLFFHEDCEWPPGSGGISDEPMYGPPELMPKGET